MKGLFNGTCSGCGQFKPRCATVYLVSFARPAQVSSKPKILCADCRKRVEYRGRYRLEARHK